MSLQNVPPTAARRSHLNFPGAAATPRSDKKLDCQSRQRIFLTFGKNI
jgi:hypothetical protein